MNKIKTIDICGEDLCI